MRAGRTLGALADTAMCGWLLHTQSKLDDRVLMGRSAKHKPSTGWIQTPENNATCPHKPTVGIACISDPRLEVYRTVTRSSNKSAQVTLNPPNSQLDVRRVRSHIIRQDRTRNALFSGKFITQEIQHELTPRLRHHILVLGSTVR
jgi:hypothetical protein